jgi:hypothetical protein
MSSLSDYDTWLKIAHFTGLDKNHMYWEDVAKHKSNTNSHPGSYNLSKVKAGDDDVHGLYKVSNYRNMLRSTRQMITDHFHQDCAWLIEQFNVSFDNGC